MRQDFKWRHFVGEIILWAVRWYCKYGISYPELEEMMEERGVHLNHTTVYRWVQRYAPENRATFALGLARFRMARMLACRRDLY